MADRDWDKELAKVDKQLASLSDDALAGQPPAAPAKGKAARQTDKGGGEPRTTSAFGVYARLTLSVALAVGITLWPYDSHCGLGAVGYIAAVLLVVGSGIWSSVWTFRHRAAKAHTLSLLIVLWGLVLGSIDVLPRIGYAKPDPRHPSGWTCPANEAPVPAANPPANPQPTTPQPTAPPQGAQPSPTQPPASKPDV